MLIRQAHPGPNVPPYRDFAQKMRDARRYKQEEKIAYEVLVDDVAGTVHQTYGGLADPTYLIDAAGHVAYYNMWTHAPTLHEALQRLFAQDGRGVVFGEGVDRTPHILAAMTEGWKGLRRGLPQSLVDLELAAPGTGAGTWLGYQLRPLLAPLTLRAGADSGLARIGLALGAATLVLWAVRRKQEPDQRDGE